MASRSLNKVMLIGNLTRDPNLRFTPNGTAVCSFGLATNRSWTSADGGEKQEKVDFHNIVAWSKLAEICGQLLKKGSKVFVEGRLQTRDWKGTDGSDRRITEIVIDNMMLLNSPRSNGGDDYASDDSMGDSYGDDSAAPAAAPAKASTSKSSDDDDSDQVQAIEDVADDIPF
jgi:single-strand DNA-binding protein